MNRGCCCLAAVARSSKEKRADNECALVLSSGREAGLVPAVGGGPHRGVRCAPGEEQLQEADESLRAELVDLRPQHELPALPGGVRVDGAGTLHFVFLSRFSSTQLLFVLTACVRSAPQGAAGVCPGGGAPGHGLVSHGQPGGRLGCHHAGLTDAGCLVLLE